MTISTDTVLQSNAIPLIVTTSQSIDPHFSGTIICTNSSPITLTLPSASLAKFPITVISASTTNSTVTITPVATGATQLTKANQVIRFLYDGTNWYREGSSYGFQSTDVTIATNFLGGATAAYSIIAPTNNFLCTITDGVVTVRFLLQITITGTPNTKLLTDFSFPSIIKSNFTSAQHCGGFSVSSSAMAYGGVGPEAASYTNILYANFSKNIGAQSMQAISSIIPGAGATLSSEVFLTFDLPS